MKKVYALLLATICGSASFSQDIRFAELNTSPLLTNPANTGSFNGNIRASSIYANHWASVSVPYVTYGASADMPAYANRKGNMLAVGIQLLNDKSGNANLQNFCGLLSTAYHIHFASKKDSNLSHRSALLFGIQGGFNNRSINMYDLYFNQSGTIYTPNPNAPTIPGYSVNYYTVNAGITFSHYAGTKLNYTVGLSGNNLIQSSDAIIRNNKSSLGLGLRYIGTAGACWSATSRLTVMPQVFLQTSDAATYKIIGSEFDYAINKDVENKGRGTTLFAGVWYNFNNQFIHTAGISFKGFRLGMGYFYQYTTAATNGEGGFELTLGYIAQKNKQIMHK